MLRRTSTWRAAPTRRSPAPSTPTSRPSRTTTTTAQRARSPRWANGTLMARKIDNYLAVVEANSRDGSLTWRYMVERVTRIELALSAWEADVLPLNYTRGRPAVPVVHAPEGPARRREPYGTPND